MQCRACGEYHNRIDDFVIVDGEVCCRKAMEGVVPESELEPIWFDGWTNEEGEVYGG